MPRGGEGSWPDRGDPARHRYLELVADVAGELASSISLWAGMQACAAAAVKFFPPAVVEVWRATTDEGAVELTAQAAHADFAITRENHRPVDAELVRKVALEKAPWVKQPGAVEDAGAASALRCTAFAAYPLMVDRRLVGVIAVHSREPLDRDAVDVLSCMAEVIGRAMLRRSSEIPAVLDPGTLASTLATLLAGGSWRAAADRLLAEALEMSGGTKGFLAISLAGPAVRVLASKGFEWDHVPPRPSRSAGAAAEELEANASLWSLDRDLQAVIQQAVPARLGKPASPAADGGRSAGHSWNESCLAVPLLDGTDSLGILAVADAPEGFDAAHEARLEVLARLATVLAKSFLSHRQQALLEEQLRQAQHLETVGRLAAAIAHDFNNLLTVIVGQCALLTENESDDPKESLADIAAAADKATAIVNRLLAYSRKRSLRPRLLNVNDVIASRAGMLRDLLGPRVALQIHAGENVEPVHADRSTVEQVIVDLVVNAHEAMPEGGTVIVETAQVELDEAACVDHAGAKPGTYVVIAVSDTGRGIEPSALPHIFEPFFTTKPFGMQSGLGLASAEGLVSQSGGHIRVYSELGKGTTFRVCFPTALQHKPESIRASVGASPRQRETVLLVDDTDGVRRIIRRMLLRLGYRVVDATGAEDALQVCAALDSDLDLLLTDVMMPDLPGPALYEKLVKLRPGMKVLFISGYTERAARHHRLVERGLPFLSKPFSVAVLDRKIRQVLEATSPVPGSGS